jgi:hypothetical protein
VVVAALMVLAAVVPLASADGPMAGTEKIRVDMPANGESITTRAPMPSGSAVGRITVGATSEDSDFFDTLTAILLNGKPSFGAKAVSCVLMYSALRQYHDASESFTAEDSTLDDLFLDVCIKLSLCLSQPGEAARHAAGGPSTAKCGSAMKAVAVKISRSGSGYVATVSGTSYTPKRSALRISCTHTAHGLKATERAANRKTKLAAATGPILGIGFASTSSSAGKLKIALGVR